MGKPSIFSNDYEQRMRKRKKMTIINIILFILILISAAYFGRDYYLEGSRLDLGSIFKNFTKNIKDKENMPVEKNQPEQNTETNTETKGTGNNESNQPEEKTNAYYEYKAPDGNVYRLEYTEVSGNKDFTGVKSDVGEVQFDIASDGSKIVFCSTSGDIILGDDKGIIKKINSDSYKSKSSGITIEKQTTMKYYPEYVWAAKPHFTSDNRVAYITYLPYLKGANKFYMWVLSIDGSSQRMAGELTNDLNRIAYDGYGSDGALRIKVNDGVLYLPVGGYKLTE